MFSFTVLHRKAQRCLESLQPTSPLLKNDLIYQFLGSEFPYERKLLSHHQSRINASSSLSVFFVSPLTTYPHPISSPQAAPSFQFRFLFRYTSKCCWFLIYIPSSGTSKPFSHASLRCVPAFTLCSHVGFVFRIYPSMKEELFPPQHNTGVFQTPTCSFKCAF